MEIVERDVSSSEAKPPLLSTQRAFPEILLCDIEFRDGDEANSTPRKKKSIFALQAEKQKQRSCSDSSAVVGAASVLGQRSVVVDGSGLGVAHEATAIHQQSLAALAAMSDEERITSQRELAATVDPKVLEFLRSRRAASDLSALAAPAGRLEPPLAAKRVEEPTAAMDDSISSADVSSEQVDRAKFPQTGVSVSLPKVTGQESVMHESSAPDMAEQATTEPIGMSGLEKVKHQLPIDLDAARAWPHMDRVEPQKLLWMTELPPPDVKNGQTGFAARFDFEGTLLPFAAQPPVQSALYHHGDEPERAGYTVDELFWLARSAVLQQRILGLTLLTNILRKFKTGLYDDVLEPPLLGLVLDAGLLILLRFALDDSAEAVVVAALQTLEALLDNRSDEVCLDRVLGWSRGTEQPSLPTAVDTKPDTKKHYRTEEAALKDDDVTRLDAVRGLVRIGTLSRIRYVLEVLQPPPPAVISALRVLTRCARHSLQLAVEVADCPRLLDTLVTAFLPVCGTAPLEGADSVSSLTSVYGVPLHHAVKLVRVLAAQSCQLAGRMVRRYGIMDALLSYVAIDPSETGMPCHEVLTLAIEAYRLWTVMLSYGLGDQQFIEFFPLLMRQLHFGLSSVSVNEAEIANKYNYDLATCLLQLCRTAVCTAWSNHQTELLNRTGADLTAPGLLRWCHVAGLLEPVSRCTRKWLCEAGRANSLTDNVLQLLGACCQFLSAFYERWARLGLDTVPRLRSIQDLCDDTIVPFVTSQTCRSQLSALRQFSSLLSDLGSGRRRDPDSLPSVGAVAWGCAQVSPAVRSGSPLPLLTALLQLVRALSSLHRGVTDTLCAPLLANQHVVSYLSTLTGHARLGLVGDWFSRHELHLATELVLLHAQQGFSNGLLCHAVGVRLMHCYQPGDEHLCAEVMRHVVFNRSLLTESAPAVGAQEPSLSCLISSCSLYERCLLRSASAAVARDRSDSLAGRVASLSSVAGNTLLPVDWWYAPLMQLYERHTATGEGTESAEGSLHGVEPKQVVTRCLQLLHLLFLHHSHIVEAISVTAHFARVCCVFLSGDALFLDATVQTSLQQILRLVLQRPHELDLTADVPGLSSFTDLYTELLDQFEGVSYGDPLFGAVVMVPLQPRHPAQLRRLVWMQRTHVLRCITTKPEQMLVDMGEYLTSTETDESVRKAYRRALASGQVNNVRNPAMFQIATALSSVV